MYKSEIREFLFDICSTVVGGIILSVLFFIFSDYVFTIPNLKGEWVFVNKTEKTNYQKFKGMEVHYKVILIQEGEKIVGTGEKIKNGE